MPTEGDMERTPPTGGLFITMLTEDLADDVRSFPLES
jgi:hypothetical protein